MSDEFGVLRPEGYTERAIFVLDRKGTIRYIDIHDIDQQPSNDELLKFIRDMNGQAGKLEQKAELPVPSSVFPQSGIIMYCTSWCPDCRRAKNWLKANNLDYTEVDIDTNPSASEQVKKWNNGKRVMPTFDINGVIIPNFDEPKLSDVLKDRLKK